VVWYLHFCVGFCGHGLRDIGVVSNFSGSDGALGGGFVLPGGVVRSSRWGEMSKYGKSRIFLL
jgi:hypothetical protein